MDQALSGTNISGRTSAIKTYTLESDTVHYNITIFLNPDLMTQATKEYIAATITHEAMHGYIQYIFKQYYLGIITDSNVVKSQFPIFWGNVGNISTPIQEHNIIANNWVNTIAATLTAFSNSPGLSTQMRDSVYRSLAWGGLDTTNVFQQHPGKCDILAINVVARNRFLNAAFIPDITPGVPCNNVIQNITANILKLRSPCE